VPQLPGSLRRSKPVRGAAESGLKTKRYLAAMFLVQPELPPVLAVLYLMHGRWKLGQGAELAEAREFAVVDEAGMQTSKFTSALAIPSAAGQHLAEK